MADEHTGKQPIFPTTQHKQKTNGPEWPDGTAGKVQRCQMAVETRHVAAKEIKCYILIDLIIKIYRIVSK